MKSRALLLGLLIAGTLSNTWGAFVPTTAIVRAVRGQANFSVEPGKDRELKVGQKLGAGSEIVTDKDSTVDLFMADNGPVLRITERSKVKIKKLDLEKKGEEKRSDTVIELLAGKVLGNVRLQPGSTYTLIYPKGKLLPKTKVEYSLIDKGDVEIISGEADLTFENSTQTLSAGMGFYAKTRTTIFKDGGERTEYTSTSVISCSLPPPPFPNNFRRKF